MMTLVIGRDFSHAFESRQKPDYFNKLDIKNSVRKKTINKQPMAVTLSWHFGGNFSQGISWEFLGIFKEMSGDFLGG